MKKRSSSRRRRDRMIRRGLWISLPVFICCLAAEGLVLSRRFRSAAEAQGDAGSSVSESIQTEPADPDAALRKAVETEDFIAAKQLLDLRDPDDAVPADITAALTAKPQQLYDAYQAGERDADSVSAALRSLMLLDIPEVTAAVKPKLEALRVREAAAELQRAAQQLAAAGDYESAIDTYRKIPKSEKDLFANAETQVIALQGKCRQNALELASVAVNSDEPDYAAALAALQEALRLLPEDIELTAETVRITELRDHELRADVLRTAALEFADGHYQQAFGAFIGLPDSMQNDETLTAAKNSYYSRWLRLVPRRVALLLQRGDYEAAEALAGEAEQIAPEADMISGLRTQLAAYQPCGLADAENTDMRDFYAAESDLTDCAGNTYPAAGGNLYHSYDGAMTGRKVSSAEFRTDGQYAVFTVDAAPLSGFDADRTVYVRISGDGRMLEQYALTAKSGSLHISQSISGVELLSISVVPSGTEDLRNTGVIFANGSLRQS